MLSTRYDCGLDPDYCELTVMTIERAFTILSVLLLIVAGVLLWEDRVSAAFVTATLGVVSWFLGYRFRLLGGVSVRDDESDDQTNADED